MLDTNVLSYLAGPQPGASESRRKRLFWMAARRLVARINRPSISSTVFYELANCYVGDRNLAELLGEALPDVQEIDRATMDKAAKILRATRKKWKNCEACFAWIDKPEHVCAKCKRIVPVQFKQNDAVIAAHAHATDGVECLFSFDHGMLELDQYVRDTLRIRHPPHPEGKLQCDADINSGDWPDVPGSEFEE